MSCCIPRISASTDDPPRSFADSPAGATDGQGTFQSTRAPFAQLAWNPRTGSHHRRSGKTGARVAQAPYPDRPAGCWTKAAISRHERNR